MESKLISKLIYERILKNIKELTVQFNKTEPDIGYFFIDDLLPVELVKEFFDVFPSKPEMKK